MSTPPLPEVWLRGPVEGVPALLQPAAHALLQANEEIHAIMNSFPKEKLWEQPAGLASAGFHLQHITGVLDRLFSYAEEKSLSMEQLKYLSEEGLENDRITTRELLENLDKGIRNAVEKMKTIDESRLTAFRGVGRKQLPSTVLGLVFHSAEHTMRHTGQLLVTVRIILRQE